MSYEPHPGITATVVQQSRPALRSPTAVDNLTVTTLVVRVPTFVWMEMLTHRVFSRNASSARAVSNARRLEEVRNDPFIPAAFYYAQRGMQGAERLSDQAERDAREDWRSGLEAALSTAEKLVARNIHQQHSMRVLAPYQWTNGLITGTEWDNFFTQRCSPLAQPEMQDIAYKMRAALTAADEFRLPLPPVHLPFTTLDSESRWNLPGNINTFIEMLRCAARCARISYKLREPCSDDLALAQRLWRDKHLSPFEHIVLPATLAQEIHNEMKFLFANKAFTTTTHLNLREFLTRAQLCVEALCHLQSN